MHDVVVIGAGLSGLLATWRLRQRGLRVVLLEAADHPGGRISGLGDPPVELGPSWVWDSERHVHALLRELGIPTFEQHRDGLDLYDDGANVFRVTLPKSAVPERRVVGGTGRIIEALVERVGDIRLGTPVRRIRAGLQAVQVHTYDAVHTAAHALVALPPARAAALLDLEDADRVWLSGVPTWMEDVAKVVVRYPRAFWRDDGLSGRAFSRRGPLMEIHDLSGPDGADAALFGFMPRPWFSEPWHGRVLGQLQHLFGDASADLEEAHCRAWWVGVERTVPADEQRMAHPRLREPWLEGRVHLISTETSRVSPGHMDGAVERAEHVASTIGSSGQPAVHGP